MTGPFEMMLALYPQKFNKFVRRKVDLVQQDDAICRLGYDERTVRRWIEEGTFPRPLAFGWAQRFWLECELERMLEAIRGGANRVERCELTRAIHASRWIIFKWVFGACTAVRADTARWLRGERDVATSSDGVPLKTMCVLSREPKRFDLYSIPVVRARARNLIAERSFPIRYGRDGRGRILVHPIDVLMCHIHAAMRNEDKC